MYNNCKDNTVNIMTIICIKRNTVADGKLKTDKLSFKKNVFVI